MQSVTENLISEIAAAKIAELGCFLVEVKINPNKIIVLVDKIQGVNIQDCTVISKFLSNDERLINVFEKHELEVSSPGIDRPLKVRGQYEKNVGRSVKVKTADGVIFSGKLNEIKGETIVLVELPASKNEMAKISEIAFNDIIETKLSLSF